MVDGRELRWAGGAMLAAGGVLAMLPGQLGVTCPLRALTGVPCPLCGMTTSVVAAVELRLGDAVAANPAGLVAVVVAVVLLIWRPAIVPVRPQVVTAGLVAMWVFQLHRFGFW